MVGSQASTVRRLGLAVWLAMAALPVAARGGEAGGFWPQFHGPRRDNLSAETGLLKEWPEGGPKLLWTFAECGSGFAGVAVVEGRIFTVGDFADKEFILALDLDGKLVWKAENGKSWRGAYPGARTTPTFDQGVLYHLSPVGRLAAFEAAMGKELWALDLVQEFATKYGTWAMAENILIDGEALLCVPGGAKGRLVALDKKTGKPIWVNTEIDDEVAYCSPIIAEHHGVRQLITILYKTIVSVDVQTGKLLWTHPHATQDGQNVTMPIYKDGCVYASSGHGTGGRLLKLADDSRSVRELWLNKDLDNCHGGVILTGGHVYGTGCRMFGKGLVCVNMQTGRTAWNEKSFGPLSLAYAEGMLYCIDREGRVSLVEADPERCRVVSRFAIPHRSRDPVLCHPVICGGRLYLRDGARLFAYDIRAAQRQ